MDGVPNVLKFVFSAQDETRRAARLDGVLTRELASSRSEELIIRMGASRAKVQSWIEAGLVCVDGEVVKKPGYQLRDGALIELTIPEEKRSTLEPDTSIRIEVVYDDADLLVINKPPGLVVHPGAGGEASTLVHGLLALVGESIGGVGSPMRPGIVHRLDKDTTGLMVVAKNQLAYEALIKQFSSRSISRKYVALVLKIPKIAHTIDLPIVRDERDRKKFTARHRLQKRGAGEKTAKAAQTSWVLLEDLKHGFLLELSLATGRTHQIRVHLQAAGASIVGDRVYGPPPSDIPNAVRPALKLFRRQALHARTLEFIHPRSGDRLTFVAEMPADMQALVEAFRG